MDIKKFIQEEVAKYHKTALLKEYNKSISLL